MDIITLPPRPIPSWAINNNDGGKKGNDIHDTDGYRLIYGIFPSSYTLMRDATIINDRLYLVACEDQAATLISCSVANILASSLSSNVAVTTMTAMTVSSLIDWKQTHSIAPVSLAGPMHTLDMCMEKQILGICMPKDDP
jgi:hypothetical protein